MYCGCFYALCITAAFTFPNVTPLAALLTIVGVDRGTVVRTFPG